MAAIPKTMSINGFTLDYVPDVRILNVVYRGSSLLNLVQLPLFQINIYNPVNSIFRYDATMIQLADNIFDTIQKLCLKGEPCIAAMLASHFFEILGQLDIQLKSSGCHILVIPFWLSVLALVRSWELKHKGFLIHMGTPFYFLAEAYLLTQNNDPAFVYLFKAIEEDLRLSYDCPKFQYPKNGPAYMVACLVDNPNNHMHYFIVKPLRDFLNDAINKYNSLSRKKSYLPSGIVEFDSKFLQRRNTAKLKIESIKFLFVLELLQLVRLRNMTDRSRIDSSFLQTLLLNRLFSLTLVVDKILYARYPPKKRKRGKDPQMWECVISYANSHGIPQQSLENLKLKARSPEAALALLLRKRSQKRFKVVTRDMYPILISYKIRNTSAHKIHAIAVISSKFDEILQSLLEAVFIIAGQMPRSRP